MTRELTPLEALLHDLNADRLGLIAQRDALKAELAAAIKAASDAQAMLALLNESPDEN